MLLKNVNSVKVYLAVGNWHVALNGKIQRGGVLNSVEVSLCTGYCC